MGHYDRAAKRDAERDGGAAMTDAERDLQTDLANRRDARALFGTALAQVKTDLAARGIGGRIKDTITGEAAQTADTAIDVARANKGVIAGTIGALALWTLRNPLQRFGRKLVGAEPAPKPDFDSREEQEQ